MLCGFVKYCGKWDFELWLSIVEVLPLVKVSIGSFSGDSSLVLEYGGRDGVEVM
jgi:hypothetical protein